MLRGNINSGPFEPPKLHNIVVTKPSRANTNKTKNEKKRKQKKRKKMERNAKNWKNEKHELKNPKEK